MGIEVIGDRYDVARRLGSGGMGDVWLAEDSLLGRPVAIKFVGERELRDTPGAAQILRDEAKHAGRLLGHPQVVSVLDLIEVDTDLHAGPAVVLEYLEGCNVGEWIAQHSPGLDDYTRLLTGLYISMSMIEALQSAHRLSILHRDVKPQNVLCSVEGRVKMADFGLSRVVEAITRTHTVWGRHTPLYAAPEQWDGDKPDEQTDTYQLAATMYHLLAGQPANQGKNLLGLLRWHEKEQPTSIAELIPTLNPKVAETIDSGLSKDPSERQSLWAMFDAVSMALPTSKVTLRINVDGLEDGQVEKIAQLTDYGAENLKNDENYGVPFVNPLEAIREAIGTTLLGASCTLAKTR